MAAGTASVERVKDRATGLDKFVLREARGSSVEVRSPLPPAPHHPIYIEITISPSFLEISICS
jgi:hypothetical protein